MPRPARIVIEKSTGRNAARATSPSRPSSPVAARTMCWGSEQARVAPRDVLRRPARGQERREEHLLENGDAIYFETAVPRQFDNAGEGECSYYLVIDSKNS
jgi:hypothetical protein